MALRPFQPRLTQEHINAAVLKTMETQVMPSEYARAYDRIRPSVVRVVSYIKKSRLKEEEQKLASKSARPKPLGPAQADVTGDNDEVENGVAQPTLGMSIGGAISSAQPGCPQLQASSMRSPAS